MHEIIGESVTESHGSSRGLWRAGLVLAGVLHVAVAHAQESTAPATPEDWVALRWHDHVRMVTGIEVAPLALLFPPEGWQIVRDEAAAGIDAAAFVEESRHLQMDIQNLPSDLVPSVAERGVTVAGGPVMCAASFQGEGRSADILFLASGDRIARFEIEDPAGGRHLAIIASGTAPVLDGGGRAVVQATVGPYDWVPHPDLHPGGRLFSAVRGFTELWTEAGLARFTDFALDADETGALTPLASSLSMLLVVDQTSSDIEVSALEGRTVVTVDGGLYSGIPDQLWRLALRRDAREYLWRTTLCG